MIYYKIQLANRASLQHNKVNDD